MYLFYNDQPDANETVYFSSKGWKQKHHLRNARWLNYVKNDFQEI